jgi:flagellar hook-associated protein 2
MGTVGLSFGSPTKGTGFDVSATVAAIVGNLKKVETPWNTQLTSLGLQDTAISSLGTLMSNLSNDLSQLTDFQGIMAQKTGSSSDTNVVQLTAASPVSTAGTHTVAVTNLAKTSSGYLAPITNLADTLSGSISIQVGDGKAHSVTLGSSSDTLAGLASAINSAGIGVIASVLTDSVGSRLSLVSGTSGANGNLTITSSIADSSNGDAAMGYTSTVTGKDAHLTVDGVDLTSASNTVTNLIPGLTFQMLAPSKIQSDLSVEQVQVVIGNDIATVENAMNTMVSDYNALISAVNTQQGNDSSGVAEPLFGSPTLSLLQQQLLGGLNKQNPNGNMDAIATNTNTTLAGSISITVGSGATDTIIVGAGTNTANTFYTGSGIDTLAGLASAINAANGGTALSYSGTADISTGTLATVGTGTALSGSISISVDGGIAENIAIGDVPSTGALPNTIYTGTGSGSNTLDGLASAINENTIGVTASVTTAADGQQTLTLTSVSSKALTATSGIVANGLGATATVVTVNGQSILSLLSHTSGSNGALTVDSSIVAASDTLLSYSGSAGATGVASTGILTGLPSDSDTLSGSITIEAGSGTTMEFDMSTLTDKNLNGLMTAINNSAIGVTASVEQNTNLTWSLKLISNTTGTAGNLKVASNLQDSASTSSKSLSYSNSSDVSNLSSLGISVSQKADGTLTFDATSLTSVLNSDYGGILGFFQNVNSWGQSFSAMLNNAGISSSKGILSLALKSNSSNESMLKADIAKEEGMISLQQKSLTAQLMTANAILQRLPSQLDGINQLYSAITGYNQNG